MVLNIDLNLQTNKQKEKNIVKMFENTIQELKQYDYTFQSRYINYSLNFQFHMIIFRKKNILKPLFLLDPHFCLLLSKKTKYYVYLKSLNSLLVHMTYLSYK